MTLGAKMSFLLRYTTKIKSCVEFPHSFFLSLIVRPLYASLFALMGFLIGGNSISYVLHKISVIEGIIVHVVAFRAKAGGCQ